MLSFPRRRESTSIWEETWRSAMVHWHEAYPGGEWVVEGNHWMKDYETGEVQYLGHTQATDCNIYNGWWDH